LPDYPFVSVGLLLAIVAGIEVIMAIQRKKTGSPVWEIDSQRMIRRIGILMLVVGAILASYGLFALNNTLVSCPAFGCSAAELWRIYGFNISLYAGTTAAAIGSALVLAAAFMGVKPEKWRNQMVVPQV
jgi:hypothetical protein